MFDIEKSIADWRRQMLAAGLKTPVPLEELEIHLREEIEGQMETGAHPQQAFENSVREMGQADALKGEFKKVGGTQGDPQRVLPRWRVFWWGVGGLVVTWFSSWADPIVLHQTASWNYWLPTNVAFATFAFSGLVIGLARWQTKWTFFWVSILGLIGTTIVDSLCLYVFHRGDWVSTFLQRGHIPWVAFYLPWTILIPTGFFGGLFDYRLWVRKWIFRRKLA